MIADVSVRKTDYAANTVSDGPTTRITRAKRNLNVGRSSLPVSESRVKGRSPVG